jgi:hypothetical protein
MGGWVYIVTCIITYIVALAQVIIGLYIIVLYPKNPFSSYSKAPPEESNPEESKIPLSGIIIIALGDLILLTYLFKLA